MTAMRWLSVAVLVLAALLVESGRARAAFTPESKEVKAAVERAAAYLEKSDDLHPGIKVLVGLTLFKAHRELDHPKIQEALEVAVKNAASANPHGEVYDIGIELMFLAEVDGEKYRPQIEALSRHLDKIRKEHGGFGYKGKSTGDTSMAQYGALGMWAADSVGVPLPEATWEGICDWLLRTQDPSGAFGYQGVDPNSYNLVPQHETRPSLTAAGLAALYISADHLGVTPRLKSANEEEGGNVLRKVRKQAESKGASTKKISIEVFNASKNRGESYLRAKGVLSHPNFEWPYSYLYALERMHSFREVATAEDLSGSWYQDGASYCLRSQEKDGSWAGPEAKSNTRFRIAETCFGVLFLVRSTKSSIKRAELFGSGVLAGGRGLPDADALTLQDGKLKAKPLTGPADELMKIVEDPNSPEYLRALETLDSLASEGRVKELSAQAQRLRKLAGGDAPEARAAAIRALGKTAKIEDAGLFIEALRDPDTDVYRSALGALQFMSRKLARPADVAPTDDASRAAAIREWSEWYAAFRAEARTDLP